MSIKINETPRVIINACDLKDFQVARIVKWGGVNSYCGRIVFRHKNDLLNLDISRNSVGESWPDFFPGSLGGIQTNYQVEILPAGTEITITL